MFLEKEDMWVPEKIGAYRKRFVQVGTRIYKRTAYSNSQRVSNMLSSKITLGALVAKFGGNAKLGDVLRKAVPELAPATEKETAYYFKAQKRLRAHVESVKRKRAAVRRKKLESDLAKARKLVAKHGK